MFGSGTQGLQSRTLSPPPRLVKFEELPVCACDRGGRVTDANSGGCTMNWYGIVIRCGEQELQTTLPHFLEFVRMSNQVSPVRFQNVAQSVIMSTIPHSNVSSYVRHESLCSD